MRDKAHPCLLITITHDMGSGKLIAAFWLSLIAITLVFTYLPGMGEATVVSVIIALAYGVMFNCAYSSEFSDNILGILGSLILVIPCAFMGSCFRTARKERLGEKVSRNINELVQENTFINEQISNYKSEKRLIDLLKICGGDVHELENDKRINDIYEKQNIIKSNEQEIEKLRKIQTNLIGQITTEKE